MIIAGSRWLLLAGMLLAFAVACSPRAAPQPTGAASAPAGGGPAQAADSADQVQSFDDQGRDHLTPGAPLPKYNSNPPTSGPHSPYVMDWGIYDRLAPKEVLVHNMEH